jgi:SHAQKYF class myb-like DNA-binding protein
MDLQHRLFQRTAAGATAATNINTATNTITAFAPPRFAVPSRPTVGVDVNAAADDDDDNNTTAVADHVGGGGNTTGRWSSLEHQRFLQGLVLHGGKNWRKIAAHVQTRTVVQVRTHAQKHDKRLNQQTRRTSGSSRALGKGRRKEGIVNESSPVRATTRSTVERKRKRKRKQPSAEVNHQIDEKEEEDEEEEAGEDAVEEEEDSSQQMLPHNKPIRTTTTTAATTSSRASLVLRNDDNLIVVPVVEHYDVASTTTAAVPNSMGCLEYVDLMKANCCVFHALPLADQECFVRNFSHFLVRCCCCFLDPSIRPVCLRRWMTFMGCCCFHQYFHARPAMVSFC